MSVQACWRGPAQWGLTLQRGPWTDAAGVSSARKLAYVVCPWHGDLTHIHLLSHTSQYVSPSPHVCQPPGEGGQCHTFPPSGRAQMSPSLGSLLPCPPLSLPQAGTFL
jgi:hypothetical protein